MVGGYVIVGASLLTTASEAPGSFTHEIPLRCEPLGRYITDLSTAMRSIARDPRISRDFSAKFSERRALVAKKSAP